MYLTVIDLVMTVFTVYQFMIFAYILMSWIPSLQASWFGEMLGKLVEPYLSIFRKFIPPIGMIDISPIVALFALRFIMNGVLVVIETIYVNFM